MGVFGEELLAQGGALGMVRGHPNRIDCRVAAPGLDRLDLPGIGLENVLGTRTRRERLTGRPALEADAPLSQFSGNDRRIVRRQLGFLLGLAEDLQVAHRPAR